MKRFIFAIISLGLLHIFVGFRILSRWPEMQDHAGSFWCAVALFFALGLVAPLFEVFIGSRKASPLQPLLRWLDRLSYLTMGIFSCLLVYTLAADVICLVWQMLSPPDDPVAFDHNTLIILAAMTATTTAIGVLQAVLGPEIVEVDIPIKNLPAAFDGFKIVQVSDLHVGPTIGRGFAEKVVKITNKLAPDLIALTGDFIDGEVEALKGDVAPLQGLTAPHGIYFVTGNHEYYWDAEGWSAHFQSMGIEVLNNSHRIISHQGDALVLAGVTDLSTRHYKDHPHVSSPHKAVEGAPADYIKILLAHQPNSYTAAADAGFHLQLSGHTHAGQYFPYSLVIRFFQRYYKGLNRHGDLQVYVNRGTGYWGPPLRTLVQGEITVIRLRPDNTQP